MIGNGFVQNWVPPHAIVYNGSSHLISIFHKLKYLPSNLQGEIVPRRLSAWMQSLGTEWRELRVFVIPYMSSIYFNGIAIIPILYESLDSWGYPIVGQSPSWSSIMLFPVMRGLQDSYLLNVAPFSASRLVQNFCRISAAIAAIAAIDSGNLGGQGTSLQACLPCSPPDTFEFWRRGPCQPWRQQLIELNKQQNDRKYLISISTVYPVGRWGFSLVFQNALAAFLAESSQRK